VLEDKEGLVMLQDVLAELAVPPDQELRHSGVGRQELVQVVGVVEQDAVPAGQVGQVEHQVGPVLLVLQERRMLLSHAPATISHYHD